MKGTLRRTYIAECDGETNPSLANIKLVMFSAMLLINLSLYAQSQKYVFLDSITEGLSHSSYTLNTLEMYGVDKDIELFNIYTKHGNLILLSVLPDFRSTSNWRKIDTTSLSDSLISKKEFYKTIFHYEGSGFEENKTFRYKLIVKRDNQLYASKSCLFEFSFVVNHPPMFRTAKATINLGADFHTMKATKAKFEEVFGKGLFPVKYSDLNILEQRAMETIYKSAEVTIGADKAFKFWTFTDWYIGDGLRVYRGIDRFLYMPQKGIIGGSYDFWFRYKDRVPDPNSPRTTKSYEELEENSLQERVMLAKEFRK